MRKVLLQLHMYLGLGCAFYLVIFGVSSINMNHHFEWMDETNTKTTWSTTIKYPELKENQAISEAIRDSLGLMGWTPYWDHEMKEDYFKFSILHYGKEYYVTATKATGKIEVEEVSKGFWWTFNSLHFLGETIPKAHWLINGWQYYQFVTVLVVLFSIISGMYFWFSKKRERKIGMLVLGGGSLFSIGLMLYIWLVG